MSGAAQLWGAAGAHTLVALVSYDDSVAPRQCKAGDTSDSEAPRADDATHGAAGSSDLPTGEAEREGLTGYELSELHKTDGTKQDCADQQFGVCERKSHHRCDDNLALRWAPERRAVAGIYRINLLAERREAARFGDSWLSHLTHPLSTRDSENYARLRVESMCDYAKFICISQETPYNSGAFIYYKIKYTENQY